MTPTFRTAGKPAFRNASLAALLLSASALAGCAGHIPPPEISYDDAAPAVQTVDPPAPVRVVALPQPLPLPGQLKPVGKDGKPEPEAADPTVRERDGSSYFPVRVRIDAEMLKRYPELKLRTGMPAEAFIETGSRSMLSYLTKPLRDQFARAFRDN